MTSVGIVFELNEISAKWGRDEAAHKMQVCRSMSLLTAAPAVGVTPGAPNLDPPFVADCPGNAVLLAGLNGELWPGSYGLVTLCDEPPGENKGAELSAAAPIPPRQGEGRTLATERTFS